MSPFNLMKSSTFSSASSGPGHKPDSTNALMTFDLTSIQNMDPFLSILLFRNSKGATFSLKWNRWWKQSALWEADQLHREVFDPLSFAENISPILSVCLMSPESRRQCHSECFLFFPNIEKLDFLMRMMRSMSWKLQSPSGWGSQSKTWRDWTTPPSSWRAKTTFSSIIATGTKARPFVFWIFGFGTELTWRHSRK